MDNIRELLINTVSITKPKLLLGLNQKGTRSVISVALGDTSPHMIAGEKAGPNPVV